MLTRSTLFLLPLVSAAVACSVFDADEGPAPPHVLPEEAGTEAAAPQPGVSIAASAFRLRQGQAGRLPVSVTRTASIDPVEITVTGLPSGVTAKPLRLVTGQTAGEVEFIADPKGSTQGSRSKIVVTATLPGATAKAEPELYVTGASGDGDRTFGKAGVNDTLETAIELLTYRAESRSIAVAPDGTISVGLSAFGLGDNLQHLTVARLQANGQLDTSFGTNGFAIVGDNQSFLYGHLVLADGKILLYGNQQFGGGYRCVLAKVNTDGKLDTSFGGNPKPGVKRITPDIDTTGVADEIVGAAIQKVGTEERILVVGLSGAPETSRGWSARLLPNGAFDPTFNGGQVLRWNDVGLLTAIAAADDGSAFVVASGKSEKFVGRLLPTGARDTAFGLRGFSDVKFSHLGDVVVRGNKVTVAAEADKLARFFTDGSRDTTFNPAYPQKLGLLGGIELAADDKLIEFSAVRDPYFNVVTRYQPNGALDPSFGIAGSSESSEGAKPGSAAMTLDADGRILVVTDVPLAVQRIWD